MISRTRNQITIQSRQTILVRPSRDSFRAWCERCLEVVAALTPESVTNLLGVPASRLCELLARGQLHAVEAGREVSLICCNSLAACSTRETKLIEGESE